MKPILLTATDICNIETALRLRVESCEDSEDPKGALVWWRTWIKFDQTYRDSKRIPTCTLKTRPKHKRRRTLSP